VVLACGALWPTSDLPYYYKVVATTGSVFRSSGTLPPDRNDLDTRLVEHR